MKRKTNKLVLLFFLLFLNSFCPSVYSQDKHINKSAQETVDSFLKGMIIYDLPEGKEILAGSMWPQWGENPVLLKYETIFEGMFDTDIQSIKGYKRLIAAQVESEAGTPLSKRCLVIAYPSAKDGNWRVLVFSTVTDVQGSIEFGEESMRNSRFLGFWYAAAGRLNDSYRIYKTAAEINRQHPASMIPQSDFDIHVETIKQIMGD